jgi:hypothetical protein
MGGLELRLGRCSGIEGMSNGRIASVRPIEKADKKLH